MGDQDTGKTEAPKSREEKNVLEKESDSFKALHLLLRQAQDSLKFFTSVL